ncbi:MAG: type I methionyl aminopeptidase [Deltaproteobacteria bacterium]|nr:type I methionyl aminopeptidase [Deltaproteobacteria bacterium]MBI3293544.1 type I methionyl aminopeptidase [Deltaproteobacteria bacterium]
MVHIKSKREIDCMRKSGRLVAKVLQEIALLAKPGVTLLELDKVAEQKTLELGATPAFKGYLGYRHSLCTSVNEQVVHGIPNDRKLVDGDIVGLDFGLVFDGFYGDSAVTVPIGNVSALALKLAKATRDSLYAAIEVAREGNSVKDVALAIESVISPFGFGIVREFVGHGIGTKLHEEPQIPNYAAGASNFKLRSGMTIAIEPMINAGRCEVKVLADKWTAVTRDGSLSAHFEHSLAITNGAPEVLTEWDSPRFAMFYGE